MENSNQIWTLSSGYMTTLRRQILMLGLSIMDTRKEWRHIRNKMDYRVLMGSKLIWVLIWFQIRLHIVNELVKTSKVREAIQSQIHSTSITISCRLSINSPILRILNTGKEIYLTLLKTHQLVNKFPLKKSTTKGNYSFKT